MLDIKLIRENSQLIKEKLLKRNFNFDIDGFISLDNEKRGLVSKLGDMKNLHTTSSKKIPQMIKSGEDITGLKLELGELSHEISDVESKIASLSARIDEILIELPNLPDDSVQSGGKENNEVVHFWGEKPSFDYKIKNHIQLAKDLKLVDYERGAKLAGEGSWIYTGFGAMLEWALINFFVQEHIKDGYTFMMPPHMLNYDCGFVAGQFPKFQDEVYGIEGKNESKPKFLLPTAETALVSLHKDELLMENELPKKYFSYTPCFRREAGSDRPEEKGMIRGHQFNKVEMLHFANPNDSEKSFEELVFKAESLVQKLGLHYRLVKLAAGDCSFAMGKTFDIEVYIPSLGIYKEVSSVSNAYDYQARRGNIKYKDSRGKKQFIHTLNGSGLATSRIMPALLETYQQKNGSIEIPEVLRSFIGLEIIKLIS